MSVKFKPFDRETSLDKQRRLFVECFPENIGTPVESVLHYQWKFNSIPGEKKSYEYVAYENNVLIGYYAAIPYRYSIEGETIYTAGMVCDVMTGIAARGKGVFTKLGKYSLEQLKLNGVDFTTGYPIRPEVIPGHKKVGWVFPFELPMYGKFISLKTFLKTRKISFFVIITDPILYIVNHLLSFFRYKDNKVKVEIYNRHELKSIRGLQNFLNKLRNEIPIYLYKDLHFLNWRLSAPEKNYFIIVLRKNDEIIAYSIARTVIKENVPCFGILDFAILRGFEKYSSTLLKENEILAKKNKAELILTMMGKKWAKKFRFLANGYVKTPYKFSFIINKLNDSIKTELLHKEDNWHLMWIDSDDL